MNEKKKPVSFSLHPLNAAYIEAIVKKQKETNSRYSRSVYMDDLITHLRTKAESKSFVTAVKVKKPKQSVIDKKYIPMFDQFWDMYDKKKARPKCERLWKKLTGKELELIFNNLPNYVLSTPDKQFRSNPETWLRNKGWNDEVITNGHQNKATNAKANIKESSHERIKRENDIKYRGSNECGLGVGEANGDMGRAMDKGQRVEAVIGLDNEPFIDY